MLILLDNRSLVAEAKERSRVKHREFHTLPDQCQTRTVADIIFSGRSFPSLQPFEFVADLTALDPQDIFGGIRGLSEARYEKDLYRVFNESAPTQNKELAAMHKTWFEVSRSTDRLSRYTNNFQRLLGLKCTTSKTPITCLLPASILGISCSQAANTHLIQCRSPTADELWASRYHEARTHKPTDNRSIMRSVFTLQTMRDQFNDVDNPQLAQKLMVLHFDYIMLMCLNGATPGKKDVQEEINHRFPNYEEQFESLAGKLRRMQSK